MSVQTQIDRISGAVSAALTALSEKGVEVPAGTKVDGLAALIAAIEAGGGGGNMKIECSIVTIAETISMSARNDYEICSTNITNPSVMGIWLHDLSNVTRELEGYFGIETGAFVPDANQTGGFFLGYSSSTLNEYGRHVSANKGYFNSVYYDGLRIENGVVYWRCDATDDISTMPAGRTYTVLIIGE